VVGGSLLVLVGTWVAGNVGSTGIEGLVVGIAKVLELREVRS
jgi:uncharacterized membrane protein YtjA (UPF0391 family)